MWESGCALVGTSSPCRVRPPVAESVLRLPNPSLGTVLKLSTKPQPPSLISAGMGWSRSMMRHPMGRGFEQPGLVGWN